MKLISILRIAISWGVTINFLFTCASWIDAQHEIKTNAVSSVYDRDNQSQIQKDVIHQLQQKLLRRAEYYHTGWTTKLIIEFFVVVLVWIFNYSNKGLKDV